MKCTTVFQPFASRIVAGDKTIDTRPRPTDYRGRLAIYAADRPVKNARALHGLADCFCPGPDGLPGAPGVGPYEIATTCDVHGDQLPFGAIIGTCMLVDCVPIVDGRDYVDRLVDPPCLFSDHLVGAKLVDPEVLYLASDEFFGGTVVEDQRAYGDFTPGRWAWILEDAKPTTARCPACWGWGIPGCPVCKGGTHVVEPIPLDMNTDLWDVEL